MTFSIDNPRGVATTPLGKYVWEKPSGEQGLNNYSDLPILKYAFNSSFVLKILFVVRSYSSLRGKMK